MTYRELLQTLANRAAGYYQDYLQAKISALEDIPESEIQQETQQYKDAAESLEMKMSAVLATVKNVQGLDEIVGQEDIDNFLN